MLCSTFSNDQLPDKRFDFQFVNPSYGYEWSKDYDAVTTRGQMCRAAGYAFYNTSKFNIQLGNTLTDPHFLGDKPFDAIVAEIDLTTLSVRQAGGRQEEN
jgi:type I restriction-modification system DNA methylase subunit